MRDGYFQYIFIIFLIILVGLFGLIVGLFLRSGNSAIQDTSVSDIQQIIRCYKCTESLNDFDTCEEFLHNGVTCPPGSTSLKDDCKSVFGGSCPTIQTTSSPTSKNTLTCYKCTSFLYDGNACESFEVTSSSCPAGSTIIENQCAISAGGNCPQIKTCFKCTSQTNDGNQCEGFLVEGAVCPSGSSPNSTGCAQAVGGLCPVNPVVCGPIDTNGDNKLTSVDLTQFSLYYGKFCSDSPFVPTSLPSCGGKDTNGDGKIDQVDLSSFSARLNAPNCFII